MSEEYLEALKIVDNAIKKYSDMSFNLLEAQALLTLEEALQRLEAIDNAKPSEALKCVDVLKEDGCITTLYQGKALETIRQALLKAQEQEKENIRKDNLIKYYESIIKEFQQILSIIKEKEVDVWYLKECFKDEYGFEKYNNRVGYKHSLTQQEYELLKRCFDE